MNRNYQIFHEKVFYPESFSINCVYVFMLGWTGGIVRESAKVDLR